MPDHELDNCQVCLGMKGGTKGNENIVAGIVMCDYCTSLYQSQPVAVIQDPHTKIITTLRAKWAKHARDRRGQR